MGDMVTIEALDGAGAFDGYLARPAGRPKAAIVVIQEIFGINPGIRAKVDAWAAAGYLALAPDLFWRVERGVQFDPDSPEQFKQAIAVMMRFDVDAGVGDIEAAIRHARDAAGGRKVGVVGFCLGGRMAYLAASRTDADASVGYYPGGLEAYVGEAHAIANPLLLHFAGADHFVPAETVAKVRAALGDNAHVEIEEYPGVDHGFATTSGARRVEDAARRADARTSAFFAANLGD